MTERSLWLPSVLAVFLWLFSPLLIACDIRSAEIKVDGGSIHYSEVGTGSTVVLLHGLFAQKEQWRDLMCHLSGKGYRAVAPDLPGFGQSRPFALPDYGLLRQSDLLETFLQQVVPSGRLHLAGNSMGGSIAALYARRHPERLHTLVFIGAPMGIVPWGKAVSDALHQGIHPFIPVNTEELRLEMRLLFASPPTLPEEVEKALVQTYTSENRHYQAVWNLVNCYQRVLLEGKAPAVPTLFLWGESDRIFEWPGKNRLRHHWPRAGIVLLPGIGHLPHLEDSNAIGSQIHRFIGAQRKPGRRAQP